MNEWLAKLGVETPDKTYKCLRAGLARGKVLPGVRLGHSDAAFLDWKLHDVRCRQCKASSVATIRSTLKSIILDCGTCGAQLSMSHGGWCWGVGDEHWKDAKQRGAKATEDYDDDDEEEAEYDEEEDEFERWAGHCRECPGLGECLGDYRESHCDRCGKHYFTGNTGFACGCKTENRLLRDAKAGKSDALMALQSKLLSIEDDFQKCFGVPLGGGHDDLQDLFPGGDDDDEKYDDDEDYDEEEDEDEGDGDEDGEEDRGAGAGGPRRPRVAGGDLPPQCAQQ